MIGSGLLAALALLAAPCAQDEAPAPVAVAEWPSLRGPLGTGVAPDAQPPLRWSETENVRWKLELEGFGHSSPVVAGDRLFLTTAVPIGPALEPKPETAPGAHDNVLVTRRQRFEVWAVERATGEVLWKRAVREELPHEGGHATGTYASASPVTDGELVVAFFGSNGLFVLDREGTVLWSADLGDMATKHGHGEGASPALGGGAVVVNWDHEGGSFVVAFDARTGKERWRRDRDEVTSWSTPIVAEVDGRMQAIVNGTNRIRGYDLASGEVIWECGGLSHNVVATPIERDGMLYATSSYEKQALIALNLKGAEGDVTTSDHVVWYRRRGTPYVPSPLLYDDALYVLGHYQGIVSRIDARTGEQRDRSLRLDGIDDVYASLVGASGRVYVVDRSGETVVLSHEEKPRELARNRLMDRFSATPALAGRELFLRGERRLYCIAE